MLEEFPENIRIQRAYLEVLNRDGQDRYFSWEYGAGDLLPDTLKDEYEDALASVQYAFTLAEKINKGNPQNSDYIYFLFDAWRSSMRVQVVDVSWRPNLPSIIANLTQNEQAYSDQELRDLVEQHPVMAVDREIGNHLFEKLSYIESQLKDIAPVEGSAFSHIQATFYSYRYRSYMLLRYRLDIQGAHTELDKAKAMVEGFKKANPDFRNAYIEDAIVQTERAYLYKVQMQLTGQDHQSKICFHLKEATSLWDYTKDRWGKIIDYERDADITNRLIEKSLCEG